MSTITTILEPAPDGTLHIPVPVEWRNLAIRIKAELEPVSAKVIPQPGSVRGIWMASDFDEPLEDFQEYME